MTLGCLNCKERWDSHIEGKCLFGPGRYMVLTHWTGATLDYEYGDVPGIKARRFSCGHCGVSNVFKARRDLGSEERTHCSFCRALNDIRTKGSYV